MNRECFMCVEPASDQYTKLLESGTMFEDKWVCEACIVELRQEDWIEVHEGSILMRGGDDHEETEPE